MIASFHFLRPLWLLALPLGLILVWRLASQKRRAGSWRKVVDPVLQQHVLVGAAGAGGERRWPFSLALLAWTLATVALAGPSWEHVKVPALRSGESLVVVLDLSRSMDAADIAPSRLGRAKLKMRALLEQRTSGQTALVVFSANAFTVTPLTDDTRTIAALVGSLESGIMPSRGSYPETGLKRAAALLEQAGAPRGDILLMSDAAISARTLDTARELAARGIHTHVLAFGTEEGAPIPEAEGGFVTDGSGNVVVAKLDVAGLRTLARVGGGRFAVATPDDRDLATLFPAGMSATSAALARSDGDSELAADVWRDEGRWLVLALMPLVALAFRRGWVACVLLVLAMPPRPAQAFEWSDLWQRRDQQGYAALAGGDAARASKLFADPAWRAAAEYRAGDFAQSAATLADAQDADALYNRGNAFAKAGQLDAAIDAYKQALKLDPDHEDARYNLKLLEQARREQQQRTGGNRGAGQKQQQQQQSGSESQNGSTQSAANGGEQNSSSSGTSKQQSQQGANGASQASSEDRASQSSQRQQQQASNGASARASGSKSGGAPGAEDAARENAAEAGGNPRDAESEAGDADDAQKAPTPAVADSQDRPGQSAKAEAGQPSDRADLEQWASEQAAEQWLRRIPQDPGGLLRRKFLYQYQRRGVDQNGDHVWPGDESEPW